MSLMAFGHVLSHGMVIGGEAAHMRGDAFAAMEDLYRVSGEACFQLLVGELIRNAVIVAIDLDMVVDVHAHRRPVSHDIALGGKRLQRGSIQGGIERGPGPFPLAERPLIQALKPFAQGLVEFGQGKEFFVAECRDQPPFG